MYVLDTNVLCEIVKETPDASVADWLKACPIDRVFTTLICQSELLYGVRRLPESRRRHRLQAALASLFGQVLTGRVLTFGEAAASAYTDIRIARERAGRPVA
jgi:predicted nucleic acid-binding protein